MSTLKIRKENERRDIKRFWAGMEKETQLTLDRVL
jgi:hypothetical protein